MTTPMPDAPDADSVRKHTRWLRVGGTVEGASLLLLLFVAMPLKYLAGMPLAVRIVGSVHGALFLLFCLLLLQAYVELRFRPITALLLLVGAVVPFGFLLSNRHLARLREAPEQTGSP